MTDARAPAADDIRIFERQPAEGNVIKWDVFFVQGHFRRFSKQKAAYNVVESWAKDNNVSAWITKNRGQDWQPWRAR